MNKKMTLRITFLSLLVVLILAACSTGTQELKTEEIVEQIRTELEAEIQSLQQLESDANSAEEIISVPISYNEASALAAEGLQEALIDVYRIANPSIVFILNPDGTSGSGFVYDSEGHIVTNSHVVGNQNQFEVVFASRDRMQAELIGADVDSDLAVIRVSVLPEGVVPLQLAEPDNLEVGQFVVAIGNPFGEQGSMSFGIVSGLGRSLPSQRILSSGSSYSLPEVIQTDAPINPGNSGGPLLNLEGDVVGVNAAIASQTGENTGVGFSIPVAAVWKIVPSLIDTGFYVYSYIGLGFDDEVSLSDQSIYGLDQTGGAYVVSVNPTGPAAQAGFIAADQISGKGGDLIIAINGKPVKNFADLNSILVFETSVGQTIEFTIIRDGEQIVIPLTLGARP